MSADFICWIPALALVPAAPDFLDRVEALQNAPMHAPAPEIVSFVKRLTGVYPDLTETSTDTAWADGPLLGDANGGYINFSIRWDYYEKVRPLVISSAQLSGLNCYDPQTSESFLQQ